MEVLRRQHKVDRLIARDGFLCHWCHQPFSFDRPLTLEHLLPRFYGGRADDANLVLACLHCNSNRNHIARCEGCGHRVRRGGFVQERQVWHTHCIATPTVRSQHAPARPNPHTDPRALIPLPRTGEVVDRKS